MNFINFSGKGLRDRNEDFILTKDLTADTTLYIVADGMGGYPHGEIASQVAADSICRIISENKDKEQIVDLIQKAVKYADEQIKLKQIELCSRIGTTFAAVYLAGLKAYIFWLGDVQIQHYRDDVQLFISHSHTLLNEICTTRRIPSRDIMRYKHIVTRSLSGTSLLEELPIVELDCIKGDFIIISTDGLYNAININPLIHMSTTAVLSELEQMQNVMEDNYSIILINV